MISRSAAKTGRISAVGYVRRSTDRQEQSIPDQKRAIEQYAAEHDMTLLKFYVDDAISGTSTIGRKAFQQMMTDAQSAAAGFETVVVYDVKRFGRVDNDEAGYYRHILRTHGVDIRYITENFTGDGTDDLLRPVKQWQARQESKDLSKVTIRGLTSKMDIDGGGWWMGGAPPYGYDLRYEDLGGKFLLVLRFMPDGTKQVLNEQGEVTRTLARGESLSISKRDRAKLVPSSPERVQVIERIFKSYAEEGRGFKAIAEMLNAQKVPTARGPQWSHIYSGHWTDTTIRAILVNPIYVGDMVWNRRTDARFHKIVNGRAVERQDVHGARLVPNDETDWMVVRDAHAALAPRRLFERARETRENRPSSIEQRGRDPRLKVGRNWQGKRSRFILSGLLTCGTCGNRYQGVTRRKGKVNSHGGRVHSFSYGCGGYITKGRAVCQMGAVPKEELESGIIDAVLEFYSPYLQRDGRRKLAEAVRAQIGTEAGELASARDRLDQEQKRITGIINNLLDNITPANREYVDGRLSELKQQNEQLQSRAEELDRLALAQVEVDSVVADILQFLGGLDFTLRQGLPQEQLVALRRCIHRTTISGATPAPRITAPATVADTPATKPPHRRTHATRAAAAAVEPPPQRAATVAVYAAPGANLTGTVELTVLVPTHRHPKAAETQGHE